MLRLVQGMGAMLIQASHSAGYGVLLLGQAALQLPFALTRRRANDIVHLLYTYTLSALPVTLVVSTFTGMILALQSGISLEELGQENLLGRLVATAIVREMGPVFTALILAASIGSGVAAEIGTMRVSEEIDALEIMSISPIRFLVMPRVLALTLICPVMTAFADIIGILGGAMVSLAQFNVSWLTYHRDAVENLAYRDVFSGLLKAVVFGLTIGLVGCTQGLLARGGATGVGEATRRAVVSSFLLIIFFTYFISWLVYRGD
ncbi:MAG: ABC transporter permease [Planctomycetota bacterium]